MKLRSEVERLTRHGKLKLPVVKPCGAVVDIGNTQFTGGYFLMRPVGQPLTAKLVQDDPRKLSKIFGSLAALHAANVLHGDARIDNIIKHEKDKYLWVDFVDEKAVTKTGKTEDIAVLCCSLGVPEEDMRAQLKKASLTDPDFQQWVLDRISDEASRKTSSKRRRLA